MSKANQEQLPIQPVDKPILCNPYDEPSAHWVYDTQTGEASKMTGRRQASYWYKSKRTGSLQLQLGFAAEEESEDLPLINIIREDVKKWRDSNYEGATQTTKQLLRHWKNKDRVRKLFFCQIEAVETIIYLNEIYASGKKTKWKPKLSFDDYKILLSGEKPSFIADERLSQLPSLIDKPNDENYSSLVRYGCKMATGSGKTVVMAMLIAWTFCNRSVIPADIRFPNAVLVVCPNLTIKERLQVLKLENISNYYDEFDLVPSQLKPDMSNGKVLITNWHLFAPESPNYESGKSYAVVNKGDENDDAFSHRVLGELFNYSPILVLNDEAHHAYRPAPVPENEPISSDERKEREEATVWISGLDKINKSCGIKFCVDLSATPFYISGSGYTEGMPFPWLVSDFGLVDAIESGIVKIPRLPVSDTTGRPEPKYFALWKYIMEKLKPGEKLPGGKPKPEVIWREAEDALKTLASQWIERYGYIKDSDIGKDKTPPVMIIVCDNTNIAELFFKNISGEETIEIVSDDDDEDVDENEGNKKKKKKEKVVYGTGKLFPDFFSNTDTTKVSLRIDSKLLAEAESEDPNSTKKEASQQLRKVVNTIGKQGRPGEQIRCVVSVQMLNEGWDANNVTHILGLRAFGSQLLCEQVVGRGLRRMDYTTDPNTGLLVEEYVDIYGVPFSVIPFKGRTSTTASPEDKPKNHVRALDERSMFEIKFPVVEGFVFALEKNLIRANIKEMEPLVIEPAEVPTAVFVKPQVGYHIGAPGGVDNFQFEIEDRQKYYESTHIQTIKFEISRQIVWSLTEGSSNKSAKMKLKSRHQLFPQVYNYVNEYIDSKVDFRGCHKCELGLEIYVKKIVERFIDAIEPDDVQGEPPLLPILNRYKREGSTSNVNFKTVRRCVPTIKSHINLVSCDTKSWEEIATFKLEQSTAVLFYARNDHLEFSIPYEFLGLSHHYTPDFIVRLPDNSNLILEIKGQEDEQDRAKHQAAKKWISAVNNWGEMGLWRFAVCKDPQILDKQINKILNT